MTIERMIERVRMLQYLSELAPPAPWTPDDRQEGDIARHVLDAEGDPLARIELAPLVHIGSGRGSREAAAQLMAAAPELLEIAARLADELEGRNQGRCKRCKTPAEGGEA